jgi:hypothetical protein
MDQRVLTADRSRRHDTRHVDELTFRLPPAPPDDYLHLVKWWRDASTFTRSVATLGALGKGTRSRDPALNLLDFDAPEKVEKEARRALEEGKKEIAPVIRVDGKLAADARKRGRERLKWLEEMAEQGAPALHRELRPLVAASNAVGDETLRAAGYDVGPS